MENISNPQKANHIKCDICNKILTGKQTKFCSRKCKNSNTNNKHQNYVTQQQRGLNRKLQLIKLFGGKCDKCGYSKNSAGLCFHHINPNTKNFPIDMRSCSNHTWDKLVEEASKCKLFCLICHAEHHNPDLYLG